MNIYERSIHIGNMHICLEIMYFTSRYFHIKLINIDLIAVDTLKYILAVFMAILALRQCLPLHFKVTTATIAYQCKNTKFFKIPRSKMGSE